jgi:hypothetical protein
MSALLTFVAAYLALLRVGVEAIAEAVFDVFELTVEELLFFALLSLGGSFEAAVVVAACEVASRGK